MVSPSEGNEVRREGLQGVAAPHSSVEAGERPFRTPWSEGGATLWTGSWNHAEDICASPACHRETTQSCEGQRFPNVTNRMRLTRTSGSVGAPGSNPWSDPAIAEASSETSLAQEEVALAPVLRSAGPRARGDAWFDRIAFSRLLGRTFRSSRCGSAPSGSRSGRVLSVVIRPKSPTDGS